MADKNTLRSFEQLKNNECINFKTPEQVQAFIKAQNDQSVEINLNSAWVRYADKMVFYHNAQFADLGHAIEQGESIYPASDFLPLIDISKHVRNAVSAQLEGLRILNREKNDEVARLMNAQGDAKAEMEAAKLMYESSTRRLESETSARDQIAEGIAALEAFLSQDQNTAQ